MRIIEITLTPEEAFGGNTFEDSLYKKSGISRDGNTIVSPLKRSIDARAKKICVRVQCQILEKGEKPDSPVYHRDYKNISNGLPVIIVGAGPAGLFAALRLIELGVKPVILERGKDVQTRRRDLAAINKEHIVNSDSNYCFGEGGAGTYSDGKLYTRSGKRGDVRRILEIMIAHGAKEDIRYDAHPHIGTNKLPNLIAEIRETILQAGGEIHFNTRVADFVLTNDVIQGVITHQGDTISGKAVILATGHSATDIFELLFHKGIEIHAKPFALGVRVEHPQELIDQIQYHCTATRGPYLPASSYSLVHQATIDGEERGVFSFCMCPGGFIVPAATSQGEIVVNGMSPSRRDSAFANSGIVVSINEKDIPHVEDSPLSLMYFQREIERRACRIAGDTQVAPAQRLVDFVSSKVSSSLLKTSYQPGIVSVNMEEVLPEFVAEALRQGFINFGKKMKGYFTNEAQIIGVESRTSSPIRIPRDKETLEHTRIKGLFPCGEGAGYAGGIMSAAMDGEKCAEAVAKLINRN